MNLKKLEDTDAMPYGKAHKGIPMSEVPTKYCHWFWHEQNGKDMITTVTVAGQFADYIRRNKSCLMKDNEDLIWD